MERLRDAAPALWAMVVLLACLTGPARGQQATEESDQESPDTFVSGRIGDKPFAWRVHAEQPHPSAVISTLLPGVHNVRIVGYADDQFAREGSVTIAFVLRDEQVQEPEVRFFPFAPLHPRFSYGKDHGSGGLIVESVQLDTGTARIQGRFSGTLFYHQSPNTRPIPHRTREAEIEFSVVAVRQ